jgi:hypothetical protein
MNTDSLPWGVIAVILCLVVVAVLIVKRNKSSSASSAGAAPTGIVASVTNAAAAAKRDLTQHADDLRDALTRHGVAIAQALPVVGTVDTVEAGQTRRNRSDRARIDAIGSRRVCGPGAGVQCSSASASGRRAFGRRSRNAHRHARQHARVYGRSRLSEL